MDFNGMKRKELQALCKKHKIPANLSNREMANKLSEIFKEKEILLIQGVIKGQDENVSETESTNVVMNRKIKKVRFSPEHELIEFTRSRDLKRRSRRNTVSSRNSTWSVENVDSGEMNNENVGRQGRVTRSRGLKLMEGKANENKRGRKGVKCYDQKNKVSAIENFDNGELREGDVDRVMRLRGKIIVEGVKNASTRGSKRAKHDDKRDKKASDNVNDEKLNEEIVDSPGRLTRSKVQKLTEASMRKEQRGRKVVKNIDNVSLVSAETDDNRVVTRSSFRNRGVVGEEKLARGSGVRVKSNGKGWEEVLENDKIAGVHVMIEPQILLRRSKRNVNRDGESQILNDDARKHENGGIKGLRKTPKLLAADGSGVDAENTGSKVDMDGRVLQIEEPTKLEVRRSNRRKYVIASHEKGGNGELKAETENGYPLRSLVPQLGIACGVSKVDRKVPQPSGVMRRSRRKTSSLKLVSSDEKFDTDAAVENFETEKHLSKPCLVEKGTSAVQKNPRRSRRNACDYKSLEILDEFGGDSIIQQKNEARKRKRGPISAGDVVKANNDPSSLRQSMKESGSEKAATAAAIGKVADQRKPPSSLKEPNMLDASSHKGLLEIGESLFVNSQLSVSEGAESTSNPGLSCDASTKNINSDVGPASSRKNHRKKQDMCLADSAGSADTKLINEHELGNSDKNAASRIAELKTDSTDSEKQISASNIRDVEKVNSLLEFDVQELIEQNITNMDKNHLEAHVFSQNEDSSCNNMIENKVLLGGSNVSGNEVLAETSSSAGSLLLGDQTDFKSDLEVTEAEADKHMQPSFDVVDHDGEVEGIFVQENLDSVETGQANAISLSIACHHNDVDHLAASDNIFDNNNEDTSTKAGEVGAFESCRCIDSTDSKSVLRLKEPSSGKLRSIDGDNTAEGDETYIDSELAETEEGGCLKDRKIVSNEDSEFGVPDLFDGERSARITPQDRGIFSGEYSVMNSDELARHKESLAVAPISICANSTEINRKRGPEADHIGKRDETYFQKSIYLEVAETDEGGSSKGQKSKCDEHGDIIVSNLFDAERRARIMPQDIEIFSGENSTKDFGTGNRETSLAHRHEADQIAEGDETYKDIQSELAKTDEGGCLKNHKSTKDEEWIFSVFNLFEGEKSARITPQDRGITLAEDSIKDFNEQVMFHDLPPVSTMRDEVTISAGSSSLQEISPSKPNSVSKSQGTGPIISGTCEIIDKDAGAADTIQEKEVAIYQSNISGDEMSMDKTVSDGDHEIFNQADEHTNKYTYEQAEQPKSPLAKPTAIANTIQGQEAWSSASETTGHVMRMFKTSGKGKTSQVVEGSNTDDDANEANCGKDKEDFADACIADIEISMDHNINKIGVESLSELKFQHTEETEYQYKDLLERHRVSDVGEGPTDVESSRSWTEIELNNLFGTTVDNVTPTGLNDTSSQGSELANLTMSVKKSNANCGGSLTKKKKGMEGERGSECAKSGNKNVVLPTNYKEVSDTGSSVGREENQLKLLFATPIKIVAPCKVDESSAHDKKLDRAAMSTPECVGTMKEIAATQIKSDETVRDNENELENSICLGNSSSDNSEDVTNEELHEVESVALVNISTTVLSEAEYDGYVASGEQLTENTCKCLKETNFIKEEKIIPLGQSCLNDEATDNDSASTEKNIISSSVSLRNLDKLEGCRDMLIDTDLSENLSCGNRVYNKSKGQMAQSSEAAFELSDADFQKSNVPENSYHLTACYEDGDFLRKTSIDTFRGSLDAEIANTDSFDGEKDAIDKGTSPRLFSKAFHDDDKITERKDVKSIREDDDPYGAKIWDETDGNTRSSLDISDELHTNSEVAILKSLSVGYTLCQEADKLRSTLELQSSTCKETKETGTTTQNVDNIVPAAEHGSSVSGAESDILSNLAMHLILGDNENGDIEKSEGGTPVINLEGGHEKNSKEVEENSTATIVQFSIPGLHLEENVVDFNNDIHTISDVPASGCNEFLKESDVADTIKEYIDSESSLSVDFEDSGASFPIDVLAHIDERTTCENAALCKSEEDIDGRHANSESEDDKPSVESLETETKELEETTLFMEPAPQSGKAVKSPACADLLVEGSTANKPSVEIKGKEQEEEMLFKEPAVGPKTVHSPACVDLVVDSGSAVNDAFISQEEEIESEDGHRSSFRQLCSTVKKNARTILIHGTPRKLLTMADMKENAPTHKSSNIGDFTAVRPAKRRALQDVQWK
ncbi:hypothetical protein Pfo_021346 [Paulownia fortunei]|nr:hypothetical protein Pfo_021346 [Paulownia fortunei]